MDSQDTHFMCLFFGMMRDNHIRPGRGFNQMILIGNLNKKHVGYNRFIVRDFGKLEGKGPKDK